MEQIGCKQIYMTIALLFHTHLSIRVAVHCKVSYIYAPQKYFQFKKNPLDVPVTLISSLW